MVRKPEVDNPAPPQKSVEVGPASALPDLWARQDELIDQSVERQCAREALICSERRLQAILDTAMDAIITVDEAHRIVLFNNSAESMFGWSRAEALGQPLDLMLPERFRAKHRRQIAQFGSTGVTSRQMEGSRTVVALHRSGREFIINAAISQISDVEGKLYTVILRDVSDEVRKENELLAMQAELRSLAIASNQVREQEKGRIARELHDELGQAMTALKMEVAWIKQNDAMGRKSLTEKLTRMQDTLDETVAAMRRIAANLRPLILDDLGFLPAVESLAEDFKTRSGIDCELSIAPPTLELPEPYATGVFRVLQESLTNCAKHAQASRVNITLGMEDWKLHLTVRDNGCGFDPSAPRKSGAYGLMGLRERAYLMGGTFVIDSAPGRGTVIQLRIPITEAEVSI